MLASIYALVTIIIVGFGSATAVTCTWLVRRSGLAERKRLAVALDAAERSLAQSKTLNAETVRSLEGVTTYCTENAVLAAPEHLDYVASELAALRERVSSNSRAVALRDA